ncbi:MAG: hypothetical protein V2B20_07900 [Pseudomonadota bacterium]
MCLESEASHYSGHYFQGKVVGDGEIVGTLTTRKGTRLNLKEKRR